MIAPPLELDGLEDLPDLFAELEDQLYNADFTQEMRDQIPHLQEIHRRHWMDQADPGGTAWAPLAESTIAGKGRRSGHQASHSTILVDTGRLFESLVIGPASWDSDRIRDVDRMDGGTFLVFGTAVPYSIFHDTGTSRMPARVHVGMNDSDVDEMAGRLADAAVAKLREGG